MQIVQKEEKEMSMKAEYVISSGKLDEKFAVFFL